MTVKVQMKLSSRHYCYICRNRDIIKDLIQRGADELSIPLCVGGGIRTVEDFRMILAAGADKYLLTQLP